MKFNSLLMITSLICLNLKAALPVVAEQPLDVSEIRAAVYNQSRPALRAFLPIITDEALLKVYKQGLDGHGIDVTDIITLESGYTKSAYFKLLAKAHIFGESKRATFNASLLDASTFE